MASLYHIVASLILVSLPFFLVTPSSAYDPSTQYCNYDTTISNATSPIFTNINQLLATTVAKFEQGASFVKSSSGKGPNQIYGLAQCTADVGPRDCVGCIHDAAQQIKALCPGQADARIWYDSCFLRYGPTQFFGKVDTSNNLFISNPQNVADPRAFHKAQGKLFSTLRSEAVKLPNSVGFAKGEADISEFDTVYGVVQCTRDLGPAGCGQCLDVAFEDFKGSCGDSKGCRIFYSSCYVRYELYPFISQDGDSTLN